MNAHFCRLIDHFVRHIDVTFVNFSYVDLKKLFFRDLQTADENNVSLIAIIIFVRFAFTKFFPRIPLLV